MPRWLSCRFISRAGTQKDAQGFSQAEWCVCHLSQQYVNHQRTSPLAKGGMMHIHCCPFNAHLTGAICNRKPCCISHKSRGFLQPSICWFVSELNSAGVHSLRFFCNYHRPVAHEFTAFIWFFHKVIMHIWNSIAYKHFMKIVKIKTRSSNELLQVCFFFFPFLGRGSSRAKWWPTNRNQQLLVCL